MERIGNLICDPQALLKHASDLEKLSTMLDRVTRTDLERASRNLKSAGQDIGYLLSGRQKLIGCPCRVIDNENNNTSYLVYEDACPHHKHLKAQLEEMKRRYDEAEKRLTETIRTEFAKAALAVAAVSVNPFTNADDIARRALQIADAMIAALF